jgi:DNA modification methylase
VSERVDIFGDGRAIIYRGDCLEVCRSMPDDSVDLVFGSPFYPNARTYGIGIDMAPEEWATWMTQLWVHMQRISNSNGGQGRRTRMISTFAPRRQERN